MIYTSYFKRYIGYDGTNGISIANRKPKGVIVNELNYLAPSWELVLGFKSGLISQTDFIKQYLKQLKKLNPLEVASDLEDSVILCWEKSNQFCHRFVLAHWLNKNGILVDTKTLED